MTLLKAMIQPISGYFFKSLLFGLFCCYSLSTTLAQENTIPPPKPKKEKKEWAPLYFTGARVGIELLHLAESVLGSDRSGFEINADATVNNKYFFVVDFGLERYRRSDPANSYEYTNTGQYLRVGLDYNLLHKKTDDEAVSFGLRYANANFRHEIAYELTDSFWGEFEGNAQERGLSANWVEVVASFKVRLLKNLYLSPNFRIKFLAGNNGDTLIQTADIPGYGVAKSSTRASVNYSLLYRLPFGIKN